MTLLHEDKIITNDDENVKILNLYCSNVVKQLKIPEFEDTGFSAKCISHPVLKALMKFRNHPSVSTIRNAFNPPQSFSFSNVSIGDALEEVNKLGYRKVIKSTEIPAKILKQNADNFGSYFCHLFNVCVDKSTFSSVLKHTNITPVFIIRHRGSNENYRPVSILLCNYIPPFMG